ncbi:MAG TPA: hypothetical protein VFP12_00075 [Allosphingosinicella sp.]|nr:hypothetical protein [Allosphingosinicella sp.]
MPAFVTVDGEHGYWVGGAFFDLWLLLLALHIHPSEALDSLEARISNQWLYAARTNVGGLEADRLEEFAREPAALEIIRSALASLTETLERLPETINPDAFELLGFGADRNFAPTPRSDLLAMAAAFADLLDGRIEARAGDKLDALGRYGRSPSA